MARDAKWRQMQRAQRSNETALVDRLRARVVPKDAESFDPCDWKRPPRVAPEPVTRRAPRPRST